VPDVTQATTGDGNGDGVLDTRQVNVASALLASQYVTLVADAKAGKIDTTDTSSAQVKSLVSQAAPDVLPRDALLPLGLTAFDVAINPSTPAESFSIYVAGDLEINGFWALNAKGTWVNLASRKYGGQVVSEGDKWRLDFTLRDGGEFDHDHTADGVLSGRGAIAFMPVAGQVFNDDNKGHDVRSTATGNDVLLGNQGRDHLWGGAGDNWFRGGWGRDSYHVTSQDLVAGGMDHLIDGNGSRVVFEGPLMNSLKLAGQPLAEITEKTKLGSVIDAQNSLAINGHVLHIDVNGDGVFNAEDDFQMQLFNKALPTLTFNPKTGQFVLGGQQAALPLPITGSADLDTLMGDRKANTLDGGANDDVIVGAAGKDKMIGGRGDDILVGGKARDRYLWSWHDLEARGVDQVIDGRGSRFLFDTLTLETLTLNGQTLAEITAKKVFLGQQIDGANGLAYRDGVLQVDVNGDGVFQAETDFQIQIIGTHEINGLAFNGVKGWVTVS